MTTQANPQTLIDAANADVRAFCGYGPEASDAAEAHLAEDVDLVSRPPLGYGRPGIMAIRARVFDLMPQIEKDHDEPRRGACAVIDLKSVAGATLFGPVRMAN